MKIFSTKKILALFSVTILVLIGLHYWAFSFFQHTGIAVSTIDRDVNLLQAQVAQFEKNGPDGLAALAQSVTNLIISRTNIAEFIENLEKQAKAQNLAITIRSVGVEPRAEDEKKGKNDDKEFARFIFETRGSWADTQHFISFIEHLPYKIALRRVELSLSQENSQEHGQEKSWGKNSEWRGQFEITALKFK